VSATNRLPWTAGLTKAINEGKSDGLPEGNTKIPAGLLGRMLANEIEVLRALGWSSTDISEVLGKAGYKIAPVTVRKSIFPKARQACDKQRVDAMVREIFAPSGLSGVSETSEKRTAKPERTVPESREGGGAFSHAGNTRPEAEKRSLPSSADAPTKRTKRQMADAAVVKLEEGVWPDNDEFDAFRDSGRWQPFAVEWLAKARNPYSHNEAHARALFEHEGKDRGAYEYAVRTWRQINPLWGEYMRGKDAGPRRLDDVLAGMGYKDFADYAAAHGVKR